MTSSWAEQTPAVTPRLDPCWTDGPHTCTSRGVRGKTGAVVLLALGVGFALAAAIPAGARDSPMAPNSFAPVAQWTFQGGTSSGYRFVFELQAGRPYHFGAGLPALPGDFPSGRDLPSCGINPQTDGVIPVGWEITNATPGFTSQLLVNIYANSGAGVSYPMIARGATGKVQCMSLGPGCLCNPYYLPPHRFAFGGFYLVVPGLFTPNHPNGDPAQLAKVELSLFAGRPPDEPANLESQWRSGSGPSLCYYDNGVRWSDGEVVPPGTPTPIVWLDGKTHPCVEGHH